MQVTTHLRKMRSRLEGQTATYELPVVDILDYSGTFHMNPIVGRSITLRHTGQIHCVETGKKIRKTFGEGLSYEAFLTSPMASPSIVRPELSRIHEGIALRDAAWEEEHHNKPHFVYLSRTSEIKVGVTRTLNVPSRWIDQGATEAIILSETPYRQLAGAIEVALKEHFSDKTSWQAMLKNECRDGRPLRATKDEALGLLPPELQDFFFDNDEVTSIAYPVLQYPQKVKSLKLDTAPEIRGTVSGIKGQYLLFDDGRVLNIRSHAGYQIELEVH